MCSRQIASTAALAALALPSGDARTPVPVTESRPGAAGRAGATVTGPRGRLLLEQDLAVALGVPLPVARAFIKHQRLDGIQTADGRCGAYEADVRAWLALNAARSSDPMAD